MATNRTIRAFTMISEDEVFGMRIIGNNTYKEEVTITDGTYFVRWKKHGRQPLGIVRLTIAPGRLIFVTDPESIKILRASEGDLDLNSKNVPA